MFAFDHIHLRSTDLDAAAEWYVHMLGAEVTARIESGRPRVQLRIGALPVLISAILPGEQVNPPPQPVNRGLEHIGLVVEDMAAAVAVLHEKGAEFSFGPQVVNGVAIAFLRGPDEVSIELLERPDLAG